MPYPWASSSPFGTSGPAAAAARAVHRSAAGEATQRCKTNAANPAETAADAQAIPDQPAPAMAIALAANPAAAARRAPVGLAQAIALLVLVIALVVGVLGTVS